MGSGSWLLEQAANPRALANKETMTTLAFQVNLRLFPPNCSLFRAGLNFRPYTIFYGADASWNDVPEPLIKRGYTIFGKRKSLASQIALEPMCSCGGPDPTGQGGEG